MKKVFVLFALLFLFGCGPTQREVRRQQLVQGLDSAIGQKTYDDMLLRYGPPTSVTEGDLIFIAAWRNERIIHDYVPLGDDFVTGSARSHGDGLDLVFDKGTKILKKWDQKVW